MPVPDGQSLMPPVLKTLAGGVATALSEVRERVTAAAGLTPEDVQETTPGGAGAQSPKTPLSLI